MIFRILQLQFIFDKYALDCHYLDRPGFQWRRCSWYCWHDDRPTQYSLGQLEEFKDLMPEMSNCPLYFGGDVGPECTQVIHGVAGLEDSREIMNGVFMGGTSSIQESVRSGKSTPDDFRWFLRFAGYNFSFSYLGSFCLPNWIFMSAYHGWRSSQCCHVALLGNFLLLFAKPAIKVGMSELQTSKAEVPDSSHHPILLCRSILKCYHMTFNHSWQTSSIYTWL